VRYSDRGFDGLQSLAHAARSEMACSNCLLNSSSSEKEIGLLSYKKSTRGLNVIEGVVEVLVGSHHPYAEITSVNVCER
jgi:hypothetical protein